MKDPLNKNQEDILFDTYHKCLIGNTPNLVLIEGPPGTGKTRLIANLVAQLLLGLETKQFKILICSSSNAAIDTITEKLSAIRQSQVSIGKSGFKMVRFGVFEKMMRSVQRYSLKSLVDNNVREYREKNRQNSTVCSNTIRMMLDEKKLLLTQLESIESKRERTEYESKAYCEIKQKILKMQKIIDGLSSDDDEIAGFERRIEYQLMQNAQVICTTLTSCINLMR